MSCELLSCGHLLAVHNFFVRRLGERERDGEGGPLPQFAGEGDFALMEGDNLRDIVESDAEAFYVMDISGRDAVEFLKDMFLVLLGYANTVIGDLKNGIVVLHQGGDDDMGLLFGIFDGVVDKIVYHVGYVQLVGKEGT